MVVARAVAAVLPWRSVSGGFGTIWRRERMAQFKPFEMEEISLEEQPITWKDMVPAPYDKKAVDAYTRTRVILMNGIENNADLMSHAIARMHPDPEVKRSMAQIRRIDSQQQMAVNMLNPADQSVIETTIGYEQVAVDLTANLAQNEPDPYVRQTLDFALLEDFDHLYRYANLLEMMEGKDPSDIVGDYTEIFPGRPTVEEHRHPFDEIRRHYDKDTADIITKMHVCTIVAAEQQTMNYYMNSCNRPELMLARAVPRDRDGRGTARDTLRVVGRSADDVVRASADT